MKLACDSAWLRRSAPRSAQPHTAIKQAISNALRMDLRLLSQGYRMPENFWPLRSKFTIVTVAPG